jgi:hypothetical protein
MSLSTRLREAGPAPFEVTLEGTFNYYLNNNPWK